MNVKHSQKGKMQVYFRGLSVTVANINTVAYNTHHLIVSPLQEMTALSTAQSSAQTQIYNAILFINTA